MSWPALPGWWDKGLLGAQTEVVGTKEVHAAAGDVASERLGVCWVGVAKGGGTSLRGGDRERGFGAGGLDALTRPAGRIGVCRPKSDLGALIEEVDLGLVCLC